MNTRCFYTTSRLFSHIRGGDSEACTGALFRTESRKIPDYFLRGAKETLWELCPKFKNSQAPILFHLPDRTISRIVESLPSVLIGPTFVTNGALKFGVDEDAKRVHLPRWSTIADHQKAKKHMTALAQLLCSRSSFIPEAILTDIIHVTGDLKQAGILDDIHANNILRVILPMCLDKLSLSRQDIYKIVHGLNRIELSPNNAVVYPLIANFAHWYLLRNQRNKLKRIRASRVKREIEQFISS